MYLYLYNINSTCCLPFRYWLKLLQTFYPDNPGLFILPPISKYKNSVYTECQDKCIEGIKYVQSTKMEEKYVR